MRNGCESDAHLAAAMPICDTRVMQFSFTEAAERALAYASRWSAQDGHDELTAESLLLGLLGEPECRAAVMLAQAGVTIPSVQTRWPGLKERCPPGEGGVRSNPLDADVEMSLRLAVCRLAGDRRPVQLATEHLLLGLAAADHEVAIWLRQQGVDPDRLETEIRRLYGTAEPSEGIDSVEPDDRCATQLEAAADLPRERREPVETPAVQWSDAAVLRVFDAAGNRAREGLRVIEDYVRFVLDDRFLTDLCKRLRHDLADALASVSPGERLAARETQADVGTTLSTEQERRRREPADVLAANFARLQESLRSLEEFGKLVRPSKPGLCPKGEGISSLGEVFKQLRYQTYTLQRAVEVTRQGAERLASARLCVLIDGRASREEFERLARSLVEAKVGVIQLRDKRLPDRELLGRARQLRAATHNSQTLFIVNDRPDLAALSDADGVHLGQDDATVKDARRIVGPDLLIGVSTHSIEQARQAVLDGASYLGVGPTFPSRTKRFAALPGVELLRAVAAEIRLPAFAIGGICQENVAEVLAAGFTRIAVSAAVAGADDPALAAMDLDRVVRCT
ncbi:MAG: thiamine phosphate synthase, partial [Thermoguttaceae bacterium]